MERHVFKRKIYGEQSMEDINRSSTVGENDIICCSTYLSVGVDICDKGKFSIYFDRLWIPQDIEQFANRIRNNNLYIKEKGWRAEKEPVLVAENVSSFELSLNGKALAYVSVAFVCCLLIL